MVGASTGTREAREVKQTTKPEHHRSPHSPAAHSSGARKRAAGAGMPLPPSASALSPQLSALSSQLSALSSQLFST
jgi:hypothetical protein